MSSDFKKKIKKQEFHLAFFTLFAEEKKEEIIPKISERRDNYIDTASIYHEETTKYRVDNNDTVRILLDVKNNDVEKIELVYGDKRAEMSSFGYYKGKEIFSAGGRKYGNKSNRAYPGTFAGNAKQKGKSCGHLWKQPEVKEKASAFWQLGCAQGK